MVNNKDTRPDKQVEPKELVEEVLEEIEYSTLNAQLDRLNECLDYLEQNNDAVQASLLELLRKNRETRADFQKMLDKPEPMDTAENEAK